MTTDIILMARNRKILGRRNSMHGTEPELSIVVPSLNEERTIGEFIDWCHEGLAQTGVDGEILIVDSSTDRTAEIARAKGARVLKVPKGGLGMAYAQSIPHIRGKYVLMGDCDCTYDFRHIDAFIEKFRSGYEFIMGSRFLGVIEPGAMPALHRYFGTPLTTWILNRVHGGRFTDIHCGMRGITRAALLRMNLRSQSWEYASEMVLKSVQMGLRTTEVPIRFHKDREGRISHMKRGGWTTPWIAGWINLRAMFVCAPHFFLFKPGMLALAIGWSLTLPILRGPIQLGSIFFSLYWMLFGVTLAILGLQCVYMGILGQLFFDYSGDTTKRWLSCFRYSRSILLSLIVSAVGGALTTPLIRDYIQNGLRLPANPGPSSYLAVLGLLLALSGFATFTFTLLLHAAGSLCHELRQLRAQRYLSDTKEEWNAGQSTQKILNETSHVRKRRS